MSRESRQENSRMLQLREAIRGHDNSVVHAFQHTGGKCPKCGCPNQMMLFCNTGDRLAPGVPRLGMGGCEIEGEHLHLLCQSCQYPWIERCWDHSILSREKGEAEVNSELGCAMAAIAHQQGGVRFDRAAIDAHSRWILTRTSDDQQVIFTARPPEAQRGEAQHMTADMIANPGDGSGA